MIEQLSATIAPGDGAIQCIENTGTKFKRTNVVQPESAPADTKCQTKKCRDDGNAQQSRRNHSNRGVGRLNPGDHPVEFSRENPLEERFGAYTVSTSLISKRSSISGEYRLLVVG
jgi:hypothetical protein